MTVHSHPQTSLPLLPHSVSRFLHRRTVEASGLGLSVLGCLLALALLGHHPTDPSLNRAVAETGPVLNPLGPLGAVMSDGVLQLLGWGGLALAAGPIGWGVYIMRHVRPRWIWVRALAWLVSIPMISVALAPVLDLASGAVEPGGVVGLAGYLAATEFVSGAGWPWAAPFVAPCFGFVGLMLVGFGAGVPLSSVGRSIGQSVIRLVSLTPILSRRVAGAALTGADAMRKAATSARKAPSVVPTDDADDHDDQSFPMDAPLNRKITIGGEGVGEGVDEDDTVEPLPVPKPKRVKAKPKPAQQTTLAFGDPEGNETAHLLPSPELLQMPDESDRVQVMDADSLRKNAEILEGVLADFGVKGEIVRVNHGPVVTLYELEPAPGTKSARVIGLADDIARSMSALSVRVAVVPGRNVIGIELPNARRETVFLREVLEDEATDRHGGKLTLVLGKDIGGGPVLADLARMPHLLVAGTTGSGKSVAVNAMILSLLYKHTPDSVRLVLVDPKMLELSIYEGIPHLLTPVVTDPKKAIVALKWAVREMENRYRAMSKLGVRNIIGYNQRLAAAKEKGETLTRRVQTGFDPETGKPVFEETTMDMTELPYIVMVIDEVADLMLVAGKEVEAAIQRLAQMARAAGIHLIMATQRPSVDVITGTIKANFPTRLTLGLKMADNRIHLFIRHERAVHAGNPPTARHVQHVTLTQQLFGTAFAQNGPAIDL